MANEQNVRNKTITTASGSPVENTSQLKGEAKDSLSGTNDMSEYKTGATSKGKLGGLPSRT